MLNDAGLSTLLAQANTIAAVGLTDDPRNPDYQVASYQQSQGYKVIPVNPQIETSLGHKSVPKLEQIEEPVDIVNVFAGRSELGQIAETAARKGAKAIWFQPEVQSKEAEQHAQSLGLTVVSGRCFRREHQRLLSRANL
ncbi:CoA-binding protein [Alicyclobacillus tolerans]|uniref:CoA-binding protein n=1 Tax=Alicyclobacillus tolerans TaxID=90970 RepID=UPI001F414E28|nr:CoA-binding protein [Alicyclobacillus tolerans]MCF8563956.1 CoA-binding protein [Alicyclobacillus tolerans]